MLPGLPDAPGGGSASVSRPPTPEPRKSTGSLRKFWPVDQVSSQLGDVCARPGRDVETAQRYRRMQIAPDEVARGLSALAERAAAVATAFTVPTRRKTIDSTVTP